ncbi:ankyrin repeat domain-containing protein [Nocardioides sp. BP30]|uniref:ankyrin repeat domain-containing protein n=1 Tax=Nocardioides sp. BP30 TaxID=3036374 RepID=UPI002468C3A8|nr:ankyrin repeat domain-containing protein [Nocardioides sp. BP30]WGL52515.1 ankyrin repeat domain-containing protein [Nocardioides sp. BP30]
MSDERGRPATPTWTGLGFAVWSDDLERVRSLLSAGAAADEYGDGVADATPLMESVDEVEYFYDDERSAMTKLLLDHGAEVNRQNSDGRTALHYAAGAGRTAVELLLEGGADPNAVAVDGRTPLHEAVDLLNLGAVQALCGAGADRTATDRDGRTPADLLDRADEGADEEQTAIRAALDAP